MNTILRTVCAGTLLLAAGCAFNAEERVESLTWQRDFSGIGEVTLGEHAFATGKVEVDGIAADSLVLTCDIRRMVASDEWYNDLDLRAEARNGGVELALVVEGDQWTTATVDRTHMALARDVELDIGMVDKSVTVRGFRGRVSADARSGEVRVQTARGASLYSTDGDIAVVLSGDSLDPMLDSLFDKLEVTSSSGAISIDVPAGMRVDLVLQAGRNGEIRVDDVKMSDTEYEGELNGGSSHTIRCETGGDIAVRQVALP